MEENSENIESQPYFDRELNECRREKSTCRRREFAETVNMYIFIKWHPIRAV